MRPENVETAYRRWAPIYDRTFGAVTQTARRRAVAVLNERPGRVLEVGCGTGLALPFYAEGQRVTGIDFSADMLVKAKARVANHRLGAVEALLRMDARQLDFADASFDQVAAMHVLSVVPEPSRVLSEIVRVLRPGGRLVVSNHFRRERGAQALAERLLAPFSETVGWHSDFAFEAVAETPGLVVERRQRMPPLGAMTLAVLKRA
ncbi:class I SAM-dependent methyltransferase [Thetidibacter halocola]|uniref:Methyltransferase domain-containing protein n=1 Tax=Thetidibacter halocola TaxID=2827239 RepID=A0A8J7WHY1_9RHOB|nr:methyltransferase domain-containing protein [Thetidibacter halocola]MBS0125364.1 methyltransferase domain-containing protein [Thetidibacter halocola]